MNDAHKIIKELSKRIVETQKPIRILDAIQLRDDVKNCFFSSNFKKLPQIDAAYYNKNNPLNFDSEKIKDLFFSILSDIEKNLGSNPASNIMQKMCKEYIRVIDMLKARGTNEFYDISRELYGSSADSFHRNGPNLHDMGELLDEALKNINESMFYEKDIKNIPTKEAVDILQKKLNMLFINDDERVKIIESDGIVADAAAGSDYIKLKKDTFFSEWDLRVLESHEGWVHVATTLNGLSQPVCTFLGKGTPSATITQEGLAVFTEVVSFSSHPSRLRKIADRIQAISMAEKGATFFDIFEFFRSEGRSEEDSYTVAARIFRGSMPSGGPFTKDLAYSKGFILVFNFIRIAVKKGMLERIPLLFCGKLAIEDMGIIAKLHDNGIICPPKYLPPFMNDLKALCAWMAYSNFLDKLDFVQIDSDFAHLFE